MHMTRFLTFGISLKKRKYNSFLFYYYLELACRLIKAATAVGEWEWELDLTPLGA